MTLFKVARTTGVDPLLLSGGDFLYSNKDYRSNAFQRKQMYEKARLIVECYNRFGYHAATVGECELALGLKSLLKLQKEMKFSLLSCNIVDKKTKERVFEASKIVEKNGIRYGIIGAVMPLGEHYLNRVARSIEILPPKEIVAELAAKLAKEVDVVILLGHLNRVQIDEYTKSIPDIDMYVEPNSFGGNDVIWLVDGQRFVEKNGKLLLKIDGQGSHVGRIDFTFQGKKLPWKKQALKDGLKDTAHNSFESFDYSLGPQYGNSSAVQSMMDQYRESTKFTKLDEASTFVSSPNYLTVNTCKTCHPDQYTFWKKTGHGKAYETLEKSNDQYRIDCLPCHVVGYGETFIDPQKAEPFKDVQCESCHGKNPKHPSNPPKYQWPSVNTKNCWGCHNPKETKAAFVPETAVPKISCPPIKR